MTSLTVHHLGISQSERIVWLCEELGIDYILKLYARDPVTRLAPEAYKALHPVGTAPIMTDGDVCISESGAIMDYIIGKYGQGRLALKPDDPEYANYLFWYHFCNGSLISNGMIGMIAGFLGVPPDHPGMGFVDQRSDRNWALVEERLGQADYFGGAEFSAADIMMVFALTTMRYFQPRDFSGCPNILNYLQRIAARPAYQSAMANGDPGMALLLT